MVHNARPIRPARSGISSRANQAEKITYRAEIRKRDTRDGEEDCYINLADAAYGSNSTASREEIATTKDGC